MSIEKLSNPCSFAYSYIKSVILSKAESDKEDNLNFIKELDKDTWNSLKTMIFLYFFFEKP